MRFKLILYLPILYKLKFFSFFQFLVGFLTDISESKMRTYQTQLLCHENSVQQSIDKIWTSVRRETSVASVDSEMEDCFRLHNAGLTLLNFHWLDLMQCYLVLGIRRAKWMKFHSKPLGSVRASAGVWVPKIRIKSYLTGTARFNIYQINQSRWLSWWNPVASFNTKLCSDKVINQFPG